MRVNFSDVFEYIVGSEVSLSKFRKKYPTLKKYLRNMTGIWSKVCNNSFYFLCFCNLRGLFFVERSIFFMYNIFYMSHITEIRTYIKDLDVLKKAVEKLGFSLEGDVIKIPGKAQVRLKREGDFYNIVIPEAEVLGATLDEVKAEVDAIMQVYAYEVIINQVEQEGYTLIEQEMLEDGNIRLTVGVE